jgi:hypothetical protein
MDFIKENTIYLTVCFLLAFAGLASILFGLFYNGTYGSVVLDIAEDLNNGASIETYRFMMEALFNGAEIEPMSLFNRIFLSVTGVILLYASSYVWLNKDEEDGLGVIFTVKYWFTFFLLRKEKVILSETAQQSVAQAEIVLKQRKRQSFEDMANNKASKSEKEKAMKALTRTR